MTEITLTIRFDRELSDTARDEAAECFADQLRPVLVNGRPVRTPEGYGAWGYGMAQVVAVEATR